MFLCWFKHGSTRLKSIFQAVHQLFWAWPAITTISVLLTLPVAENFLSSKTLRLPVLTAFVNHVIEGRTPPSIRPFFFGANLTALQKKDGGVRPIAVGCILRRLIAKLAGRKVMEEMGELLSLRQLGYGVRGGAEAAVHAARLYLQDLDPLFHCSGETGPLNPQKAFSRETLWGPFFSACAYTTWVRSFVQSYLPSTLMMAPWEEVRKIYAMM